LIFLIVLSRTIAYPFCNVPVCVCNKFLVGLFLIYLRGSCFSASFSAEEEAQRTLSRHARVRIRLDGLGLTRF